MSFRRSESRVIFTHFLNGVTEQKLGLHLLPNREFYRKACEWLTMKRTDLVNIPGISCLPAGVECNNIYLKSINKICSILRHHQLHAAGRVKTMKKAEIIKSLTSNNKHNTIHRFEQPASQPFNSFHSSKCFKPAAQHTIHSKQ